MKRGIYLSLISVFMCFIAFSQSNHKLDGKSKGFKTIVNHSSGLKAIYSDKVKTQRDGKTYEFEGNVRVEDLGGPIPPAAGCGGKKWVCGEAVAVSESGEITKVTCVGTEKKCLKLKKAKVQK